MAAANLIIRDSQGWVVHRLEMTGQPEFLLPILRDCWSGGPDQVSLSGSQNFRANPEQLNDYSSDLLMFFDGSKLSDKESGVYSHHEYRGKVTFMGGRVSGRKPSFPTLEEARPSAGCRHLYIWDGEAWQYTEQNPGKLPRQPRRGGIFGRRARGDA